MGSIEEKHLMGALKVVLVMRRTTVPRSIIRKPQFPDRFTG